MPATNRPNAMHMTSTDKNVDWENLKLIEEVECLRMQRRSDQVRLRLDYIKAAAIALAALTTFVVLQRPESILNRAASKETIARERAKLLLESLKETDSTKRLDSLMIIRMAYGADGSGWLNEMERTIREQISQSQMLDKLSQIEQLRKQRDILAERLAREVQGLGPSGHMGQGPVEKQIREEITNLDLTIEELSAKITSKRSTSQMDK